MVVADGDSAAAGVEALLGVPVRAGVPGREEWELGVPGREAADAFAPALSLGFGVLGLSDVDLSSADDMARPETTCNEFGIRDAGPASEIQDRSRST